MDNSIIRKEDKRANVGKIWTLEEEETLKEEFNQGLKIGEIAAKHGRKYGGVKARLKKLGLIE